MELTQVKNFIFDDSFYDHFEYQPYLKQTWMLSSAIQNHIGHFVVTVNQKPLDQSAAESFHWITK